MKLDNLPNVGKKSLLKDLEEVYSKHGFKLTDVENEQHDYGEYRVTLVYEDLPEEINPKCVVVGSMDEILKDIRIEPDIFLKAIEKFGIMPQTDKLISELSELLFAVTRFKEHKPNNICEEIADVEIMLAQIKTQLPKDELDKWLRFKLQNLEMLVNGK